MAAPAACNVSIKRCFIVESPGQSNWVVDAFETIDGVEFVQLKIKNSGFGKFASGSIRKLREQMCLPTSGVVIRNGTALLCREPRQRSNEVGYLCSDNVAQPRAHKLPRDLRRHLLKALFRRSTLLRWSNLLRQQTELVSPAV